MGSGGRDPGRAAREGGHPSEMAGPGEGERSARAGQDQVFPDRHGRVPAVVPRPDQRENYGRGVVAVGRAAESTDPCPLIEKRYRGNRPVNELRRELGCAGGRELFACLTLCIITAPLVCS